MTPLAEDLCHLGAFAELSKIDGGPHAERRFDLEPDAVRIDVELRTGKGRDDHGINPALPDDP